MGYVVSVRCISRKLAIARDTANGFGPPDNKIAFRAILHGVFP